MAPRRFNAACWLRGGFGSWLAAVLVVGCASIVGLEDDYTVGQGAGGNAVGGSPAGGTAAGGEATGGAGAMGGAGGSGGAGAMGGAGGSGGGPCTGAGTVFDAFDQFSASSNPTSDQRWRYGDTLSLGASLQIYSETTSFLGMSIWRHPSQVDPNVVKNGTGLEITHPSAPIVFPADDFLHVHPGPSDEYSLVRFTAPAAASYRIEVTFSSLNKDGATTSVHVLHNGASLFQGSIASAEALEQFSETHGLSADDTIDFVVGAGGNGYLSDSTGVHARLTIVCP